MFGCSSYIPWIRYPWIFALGQWLAKKATLGDDEAPRRAHTVPAFARRLFVAHIFATNAFTRSQVASFSILPSSGRQFPKVVRDAPLYFLTATFQAPQRGDLMLLGIP